MSDFVKFWTSKPVKISMIIFLSIAGSMGIIMLLTYMFSGMK